MCPNKLGELNLEDLISICDMQARDRAVSLLSFDERLGLIVDYIYTQKKYNKKIQRLIKQARLRFPSVDISSIIYEKRNIKRSLITELGAGGFMDTCTNIIFQGYTGSGKTFLSYALGK